MSVTHMSDTHDTLADMDRYVAQYAMITSHFEYAFNA